MKQRMVIAGGTGLVGKQVVARLVELDTVDTHILLRPSSVSPVMGGTQHVTPPVDWPEIVVELKPDIAICCLGTTMKTAGSQHAFRAVDHDLVLAFAQAAFAAGAKHFIVVSSVGASSRSSNFYLKTKGEVEDAVNAMGFERVDAVRPGLLTGGTRTESRPGESLAMLISPLTNLLLWGPLSKYRSTASLSVAQAIVALAVGGGQGRFIHENESIDALAS